jgi:hypothetical protein
LFLYEHRWFTKKKFHAHFCHSFAHSTYMGTATKRSITQRLCHLT